MDADTVADLHADADADAHLYPYANGRAYGGGYRLDQSDDQHGRSERRW